MKGTSRDRIVASAAENGWTRHAAECGLVEYRRGSRHVCVYFDGHGRVVSASYGNRTKGSHALGTDRAGQVLAELARVTRPC